MDNEKNIEEKFDKQKKGKKGLIACILIVLILIGVACASYFIIGSKSKPKAILKSFVNDLTVEKNAEITEFKTLSTNFDLSAKINTDDKQSQAMFDEISKCKIEAGAQLDINNTKEIINLGLKYSNQDVIDAKLIYDGKDIYAYLDGIFDKYIKINTQQEQMEELNKVFENMKEKYSDLKIEDAEEVVKITRNTLNEEIDKIENIEQEKLTINIGDKEKKVRKTTIKLTTDEFTSIISKIYLNLSESDVFSDDEKASLKDAVKELEKLNLSKEDYILISVYTEGINNKFAGIDMTVYVKEQDMNVSIEILKKDKNTYTYNVSGNGQGANVNLATGEITVEKEIDKKEEAKGRVNITAEIPTVVTQSSKINAELSVGYDVKINPEIDEINTSNNIELNKLTQTDYMNILNKLEQRPLIGTIITMLSSLNNVEF